MAERMAEYAGRALQQTVTIRRRACIGSSAYRSGMHTCLIQSMDVLADSRRRKRGRPRIGRGSHQLANFRISADDELVDWREGKTHVA
jgi:hypothetical protein